MWFKSLNGINSQRYSIHMGMGRIWYVDMIIQKLISILGQIGDGVSDTRIVPKSIANSFDTGTVIIAIAAGAEHNSVIDSTGRVFAWGLADTGATSSGTVGLGIFRSA